MDKALIKINDLKFEIEKLEAKKQIKQQEYTKLDNECLELNFRIVSLHNEINRLKQQKKQVENSKTLLNKKKEDSQFSATLFSTILIGIPTVYSWLTYKDIFSVVISLVFGSIVVIPTSVVVSYFDYFKLKKEIKQSNLHQMNLDIQSKQKILSIVDAEYNIKENEMIELKNVIEEVEKQLNKFIEEKEKIENLRTATIKNYCDTISKKEENKVKPGKHKVLTFKNKKNGVDING